MVNAISLHLGPLLLRMSGVYPSAGGLADDPLAIGVSAGYSEIINSDVMYQSTAYVIYFTQIQVFSQLTDGLESCLFYNKIISRNISAGLHQFGEFYIKTLNENINCWCNPANRFLIGGSANAEEIDSSFRCFLSLVLVSSLYDTIPYARMLDNLVNLSSKYLRVLGAKHESSGMGFGIIIYVFT